MNDASLMNVECPINQNFREGVMVQKVLSGVLKMFALFSDVLFRKKEEDMNEPWGIGGGHKQLSTIVEMGGCQY
jgi:hypothetical protein